MKIKRYFRGGKISEGLEVTKAEFEDILKKVSYVSVSEADKNNFKKLKDDEVAGVIMGDFTNILRDVMENYEYEAISNPDCWFVNKDFVNKNYKDLKTSEFVFGEAIELLKLGFKVARRGWNGEGMFILYVPGSEVEMKENTPYWNAGLRGKIKIESHFDMYTAQGTMQPGWVCSQADMYADDWIIVE